MPNAPFKIGTLIGVDLDMPKNEDDLSEVGLHQRRLRLCRTVFFWSLSAILICTSSFSWSGVYVSFDLPRMLSFLLFFLIAGISGGFYMFYEPSTARRLRNPIAISVLVFGACLVFSTCFSKDPALSFFGSYYRRTGLVVAFPAVMVVLLIAAVFSQAKMIFRMTMVISVLGALNAVYAFLQVSGLDFLQISQATKGSPFSLRPSGLIGGPDFLGTFLLVSTFSSFACGTICLLRKKHVLMAVFLLAGLVQAAAVIVSLSRTSWIGMAVGFAVWIFLVFRYVLKLSRRRMFLVAAGFMLAISISLLAMCLFIPNFNRTAASKAKSLFTMSEKYYYTYEVIPVERPYIWRDSLHLSWNSIRDGRIFGVGLENFQKYFMKYKGYELSSISLNKFYDNPHNGYLAILTVCGLAGLLAYLSIIVATAVFICFFFRSNRNPLNLALMAGLSSALAAYLVNLAGTVEVIGNLVLFNVVLGMICAICANHGLKLSPSPESANIPEKNKAGRTTGIMFALFALIFCAAGLATGLRQMKADMYYKKSLKYSSIPKKSEEDLSMALELLRKACATYPAESYYAIDYVRLLGEKACRLSNAQKQDEANAAYDNAVDLLGKYEKRSCNPPVLFMAAGMASYQFGLLDNAIACFENALEWDSFNTHLHTTLGAFYLLRSNVTDDEEDLLKAFLNFSASTVILKFFPQVDPIAFQNTVSLGNLIYTRKKELPYLSMSVEALGLYVLYAAPSPANQKLVDDTVRLARGTTAGNLADAADIYFKFRSVKLSSDKALKALKSLNLSNATVAGKYISAIEGNPSKGKNGR